MKNETALAGSKTVVRPAPTPGANENAQTLARVALEKQQLERVRLELAVFLVISVALLVPAALDYHYFWPPVVRYPLSACWWIFAIFGLILGARQWRKTPGPEAIALDLEEKLSIPRCEVSTAAQYLHSPANEPKGIAEELIQTLQLRAASHLRRVEAPYRTPLITWGSLLALVLVAAALVALFSSPCQMAAQRILFPWTLLRYTKMEVQPGNAEIPTESDFDLKVKFSGRLPSDAKIEWQDAEGAKTSPLTRTGPDTYACQYKNVRADFTYRISGADAISADFQVRVYIPPAVTALDVEIIPPTYSRIPPAHSTSGEVTALRGSELHWRISPSMPLSKAELHFENATGNLDLSLEKTDWLASLTLKKSAIYHILLQDQKGHPSRPDHGFHLVAVADVPPDVDILSPEQNFVAAASEKVAIKIHAVDDIGLAEVKMVVQKPGSPAQTVILATGDKVGREVMSDTALDLSAMKLKPYDVLMYYAEARDNNTYDGPGITRSAVHFITIADPTQDPKTPTPAGGNNGNNGGGGGGPAAEINLMQLERDLISSTARLSATAGPDVTSDLATAQHEIADYAEKAVPALMLSGAPPGAVTAMNTAIANMNHASTSLNASDVSPALDQEGQALADLFQVARWLPSKPNTPKDGQGAELRILLEKMRKDREEKKRKAQAELSAQLAKAQELLKAQKDLKEGKPGAQPASTDGKGKPKPGSAPGSDAGKNGSDKPDAQKNGNGTKGSTGTGLDQATPDHAAGSGRESGQPKDSTGGGAQQTTSKDSTDPKKDGGAPSESDQGQGGGSQKDSNKDGKGGNTPKDSNPEGQNGASPDEPHEGRGAGPAKDKPDDGKGDNSPKADDNAGKGGGGGEAANPALIKAQQALADQANALAARLRKSGGDGSGVGHQLSTDAGFAADQMLSASNRMQRGEGPATEGVSGDQGRSIEAMTKVVKALTKLSNKTQDKIDVEEEGAPPEYSEQLSRYYQKLSHED